jgi:uncharacterized membrane protein
MDEEDAGQPSSTLASSLERLVEQVLQENPDGTLPGDVDPKSEIVKVLLSEKFQGAFPHPAVLQQLDEIIPNGAERAFSMTEREQAHRHECDKLLIESENTARKREWEDRRIVIIMTFILLFISLGCAFYAVINGHPVGTGLAGGGALIALIGIFALRARKTHMKNAGELAQIYTSEFGTHLERDGKDQPKSS